ncbi:MAG: hypothetical protein EA352_05560 [Gemmatimonadales bacterium]|nr:MAG: hypothetical protein EA352_05560 [Gemmatimonadales bacterium]
MRRAFSLLPLPALLLLVACGTADEEHPVDTPEAGPEEVESAGDLTDDPRDAWWANLSTPCGNAYPGELGYAPEGDGMLEGEELLVVHFDVCDEDEIRLPFHIEQMDGEWDRSRTWIFRREADGRIELRHDHRTEDGEEDDSTWYGAWTLDEGTATEQRFLYEDRRSRDGEVLGWRVIIEPGVRYTYGTIRGDEWSWRVDFDLSEPMDELPPPAWGYEDGAGPPR